jgi:hypothetical protein
VSPRDIALVLVWTGALLLAVVVGQRARSGAWSEAALDRPPPVPRWLWPPIALGLVLTAAGAALLVWSLV